jgi:hypothetical protein
MLDSYVFCLVVKLELACLLKVSSLGLRFIAKLKFCVSLT